MAVLEQRLASGGEFSWLRHSLRQDPDVNLARMIHDEVRDAATRVRAIQRLPTSRLPVLERQIAAARRVAF